ncbi:cupredoxin domain-containing protein [Nitrososphaera sp. AFS]|uniref:cupredoxin domain-containing protein n=1 Tax=Nitrososphaera sp. AFS TaxID=2301191 RepID=UPI00139230B6|nr:cupredoxin domain-containing protein [Nitrososphaera sp. AFS]
MPFTILNLLSINDSHVVIAQQMPMTTNQSLIGAMSTAILGSSTNKTFYVFTSSHEDLNQTKLGIPPDSFSPSVIAVNKGDTVNVIFYNLETPPNGDRHSFTIGEPYNIDKDLGPGQHGVITFKATEDGTYQFFCKYHQPTMRGELIVLP